MAMTIKRRSSKISRVILVLNAIARSSRYLPLAPLSTFAVSMDEFDRTVITTMAGDGLHATQEVSVVSNSAALTLAKIVAIDSF